MEVDVSRTPRMDIDGIIEIVYDNIYLFKVEDGAIYLRNVIDKETDKIKDYDHSQIPTQVIEKLKDIQQEYF